MRVCMPNPPKMLLEIKVLHLWIFAMLKLVLFPPCPSTVARYLTMVTLKVASYGTIANKLSAIVKFYNICGHSLNVHHPKIDLLIKACKRDMSVTSRPKAPLEPSHLILIMHILQSGELVHIMFFAALIVQFFSCVRKSNLLPPSFRAFSTFKHLTRSDFHFTED